MLQKYRNEIDDKYERIKRRLTGDLDDANEQYRKWRDKEVPTRDLWSEEELVSNIDFSRKAIEKEEDLYDTYIRLRTRFLDNRERLADTIANYLVYLNARLQRFQLEEASRGGLRVGVSIEEISAELRHSKTQLEEFERKVRVLLNE